MKFVSYVYTVEPLLDSLSIKRTEGQIRSIFLAIFEKRTPIISGM